MGYTPDISIRDSDHNLIAVVEVIGFQALDEHAVDIHETYTNSVTRAAADFFLLISSEKGFLWEEGSIRENGRANHVFEMSEGGVLVIEWGDAVESALPTNHLRVEFSVEEDEARVLRLIPSGDWVGRDLAGVA